MVTVFKMPVEMKTVFVGPTKLVSGAFGLALCKGYTFWWFQAVNVSSGSLSAIAIDRFLLVFYPYKKIITRRAANVIIISIWLTAFLFTLPLFAVYRLKIEHGTIICYPEFDGLHRLRSSICDCQLCSLVEPPLTATSQLPGYFVPTVHTL